MGKILEKAAGLGGLGLFLASFGLSYVLDRNVYTIERKDWDQPDLMESEDQGLMAPTAKLMSAYRIAHYQEYLAFQKEEVTITSNDGLTLYGNLYRAAENPVDRPVENPMYKAVENSIDQGEKNSLDRPLENPVDQETKNDLYRPLENIMDNINQTKDEACKVSIILVHGYGSSGLNDYVGILGLYLKAGCNVLVIDQRAHGRSQGKYCTMADRESDDVVIWAKKMHGLFPEDAIFLHGISMGGASVIHTCVCDMPGVKGIIDDCGFSSLKAITDALITSNFHLPVFPMAYIADFVSRICFGVSFSHKDGIREVKKSRYPICFIHGRDDMYVPCSMSENLYAACQGPKELHIFENTGHAASVVVDEARYVRIVRGFISNYCQGNNK